MLIHSASQLLTLAGGPQRGHQLGQLRIIPDGAVMIQDGRIKPMIEIMASLPSVVLGFLAGLWLAPRLERVFDEYPDLSDRWAEAALLLASGMGATACAMLALLRPGDHLLASSYIYGGTHRLLTEEFTSDISTIFKVEHGLSHLEAVEEYERMSPIRYVRDINCPVLIVHSEDDLRCPINQAEELFVAMRLLGKDVTFYRFPGETHELSRSGSPVHRRQRAEIILDFFAAHLAS